MESPTPQPAPGSATFMEGCKDSLPIVISYIPVAFAFGLNATRLGFSPLESVFFSCIIYAGASQFVITAMLAAGSSLWVAALTVMAMDVRHVLYGPSLRSRIIQRLQKSKTALWAFGLTDEVFAAATAKLVRNNRRWSENWMLGLMWNANNDITVGWRNFKDFKKMASNYIVCKKEGKTWDQENKQQFNGR